MKKCLSLLLSCLLIKVAAYANPGCPSYAIPYPAVRESCHNTYGFAEFLYWKAHEDGLAWAASQTNNFQLPASPTTAEPNWRWRPGFRVGLGRLLCDGWDLSLAYTWYRSHATSSKTFNPDTAVAFGLFDADVVGSAGGHADWRLNYNTLDLALKKPFFIGERVILSPSLSLFGAYTSERYVIDNILPGGPPFAINHLSHKQRLFCIGPKTGLNSIWHLSNCWSIFGEGSIAFLWAHYRISRFDTNNNGTGVTILANLKNNFDTLRLVPFYTIGIKWNRPICNGNYCLHFKAGWEQQIWLQHNQLFLLNVVNDNTLLFNNTNLSLYGLTLSAGVQF